ncbi:alpha/beta hydrolase [Paenibacillus segetis]|uniref:Alpha/beta hydrolase n=2 Tax=Paenibacillus segetis TaxID=1325360 RepID=A0ABQ1Y9B8_9BACL|nr:alpha/beta hydrolase [Paenibacillus segetis]
MKSGELVNINFLDIEYLSVGTPVQKEVYQLLRREHFMELLDDYSPILVGTIPLDIDVEDSDLDIICKVYDFDSFERYARGTFGSYEGYTSVCRYVEGVQRIKVNFQCGRWPIEIFGQAIPTVEQNGYRHMIVEHRLLELYGQQFKDRVRALKQSGVKTEPAFARILGLEGDPYQKLLENVDWK